MSAVLRKKIESGAGIPPSILQMQEFWEQLLSKADDWARNAFDAETQPIVSCRKVIGGRAASALLEKPFTLFFAADVSPGLCAIALDERCAIQCAATRLHQDAAGLEGASSLFLKLLSEQPTITLWQKFASGMPDHNTTKSHTPQVEASGAAGALDATSRYLEVELTLTFDGQASHIKLLYFVDYMQRYARTYVRQLAERKAKACSQSPKSLSDSVRASAIALDAVLDRMTLTIGECSQLEIGRVLPLTKADAGRLFLSAETVNGSVDIGTGALGVWKRQRAVKLHTPISESFAREIVEL
ncbi:FliM/FliN family flagellar motor C-terminal domain-containing protein [Hyphomonas sp. BRH_c22]|uniref:FliM/FliN family flagellar motor C-terminal domain-containing protein n=1 Tax=Hyphomonas sp. BRH_c22 TaxID=1629710 RepID=UPI000B1892B3|nr:FliM/FliN family flagellar motor C-terminal domain-containing protein [Hyphomonas sp. BRH_c22]